MSASRRARGTWVCKRYSKRWIFFSIKSPPRRRLVQSSIILRKSNACCWGRVAHFFGPNSKSIKATPSQFGSSRTFPKFKSRWVTPWWCIWAIAGMIFSMVFQKSDRLLTRCSDARFHGNQEQAIASFVRHKGFGDKPIGFSLWYAVHSSASRSGPSSAW